MIGKYHIAGIDLGTCNSTIAIFNNGVISLVQDPNGNRSLPSMISFLDKRKDVRFAWKIHLTNAILLIPA